MAVIPPFKPRNPFPYEVNDNIQALKDLHYNKLHRVKEKISKRFILLNELGVRKCVSCKHPLGLNMDGFIVMVICDGCFENSFLHSLFLLIFL